MQAKASTCVYTMGGHASTNKQEHCGSISLRLCLSFCLSAGSISWQDSDDADCAALKQ